MPRLQPWRRGLSNDRGFFFPMVLGVLVVVGIISVVFASYVVTRARLAGLQYRAIAARYMAEAAVERAIWVMQNSPGRRSQLPGLSEALSHEAFTGTFRVESANDDAGGAMTFVATGEVGRVQRAVRATVKFSPRVLRYGLFGESLLRFEGVGSRTYVVPGVAGSACTSEGIRFGTNGEAWLVTEDAAVNDFAGAPVRSRGGEQSDRLLLGNGTGLDITAGRVGQLVLLNHAQLTLGENHRPIQVVGDIPLLGLKFGAASINGGEREILPRIDRAALQALAAANTANAELNDAVGRQTNRSGLSRKTNSIYAREEFALIVDYLSRAPTTTLRGPIYVQGTVVIPEGASLRIDDGFLVTEGSLTLEPGARLEVRHSPAFRLLPGVIAVGPTAPLVVQQGAVLIADGLVYGERIVDVGEGALVDVVGAVIGADPLLSFRNHNATVVVRYDPAVLGTIGILPPVGGRVLARIVVWSEVR